MKLDDAEETPGRAHDRKTELLRCEGQQSTGLLQWGGARNEREDLSFNPILNMASSNTVCSVEVSSLHLS